MILILASSKWKCICKILRWIYMFIHQWYFRSYILSLVDIYTVLESINFIYQRNVDSFLLYVKNNIKHGSWNWASCQLLLINHILNKNTEKKRIEILYHNAWTFFGLLLEGTSVHLIFWILNTHSIEGIIYFSVAERSKEILASLHFWLLTTVRSHPVDIHIS